MEKKREPGYYWVGHPYFGWVIASWRTDGKWYYETEFYNDNTWTEIDEQEIPNPHEYEQRTNSTGRYKI